MTGPMMFVLVFGIVLGALMAGALGAMVRIELRRKTQELELELEIERRR